MFGLTVARSSRRYTPAIVKWATCRGVRTGNKKNATTHAKSSSSNTPQDSSQILSDLMRLVGEAKSTDDSFLQELDRSAGAEPDPEASLPESAEEVVPDASLPEPAETVAADLPVQEPQVDYRLLGLKYDPSTLPLQKELTARDDVTEEEYAMTLVHGRSVSLPYLHPRTHGIPVANVHFRSHHVPLLKLFTHFALHAASSLGIPASNVVPLPTQRSLWTVIRSPFAHKKSQENFERKVHKRAIKVWDANPEVVQHWISYLRKHAMPGVGMRVTTWDRLPLGIGGLNLERLDTLENLMAEAPSEIKAFGQQIVAAEAAESV